MPVRIVVALSLLLAWISLKPAGAHFAGSGGLDPAKASADTLPPTGMGPGLDPVGTSSPAPR